jgi:hypothetical protein
MWAILPAFALSLYFTNGNVDGGADDDTNSDDGNGGNDEGRVAQALLRLALGRYSIQVSRFWRVFYLDFLYHDIPLIEEGSHRHLREYSNQLVDVIIGNR